MTVIVGQVPLRGGCTPVSTLESETVAMKGSLDVAPVGGSAAWACGRRQGVGAALGVIPGKPASTRESEIVAIKGPLNSASFAGSGAGACRHCRGGAPRWVGCRGSSPRPGRGRHFANRFHD